MQCIKLAKLNSQNKNTRNTMYLKDYNELTEILLNIVEIMHLELSTVML